MVNPVFELERLKQTLRLKGFSNEQIEDIANRAGYEIGDAIQEAIAWALDRAIEAGIEKEAEEFISEVRATYLGNTFQIMTDSGRTDFSEPPFPMLANLLKNPKVSKDGTLYKVIPVGAKNNSRPTDLMSAQQNIAAARNQAFQSSGSDPMSAGLSFSGAFAAQKSAQRNNAINTAKAAKGSKDGVKFRTATSKQDPTKQWVHPGKDKNMTLTIEDINMDLKEVIESSVTGIIQSYEEGVR